MRRHIKAERPGGLEIYHQLELGRRLNGKPAWLFALEDAIGVGRCTPKIIEPVVSVRQESAALSEETVRIDSREAMASRQQSDLLAVIHHEAIRHHN